MSSLCGRSPTNAHVVENPAANAVDSRRLTGQLSPQTLDAVKLVLVVHRLRDAVGVEDQHVARVQRERVLGVDRFPSPRPAATARSVSATASTLPGAAAQQRRQVAGVDQRHLVPPRIEHGQHQRDEAVFPAGGEEDAVQLAPRPAAGVGSLARQ